MAMSRGKKIGLILVVIFVLFIVIVPMILGTILRGTVESKIQAAVNAPVKLGSLSVSLFPAGATLKNLEVGTADPDAGGQPLAKIESLSISLPYGVVFGGALAVNSLHIYGAEVHTGVDAQGKCSLEKFLGAMPPSDRKTALPVDYFRVRNSTIFMHVPPKVLAPQSAQAIDPATASLDNVTVRGLVLPALGASVPQDAKISITLENLKLRSVIKGLALPAEAPEAGPALEEGLDLNSANGTLTFPASNTAPLRISNVVLSGLKVRNVLADKLTPETLPRISLARSLTLRAPTPKPGDPGMVLGNGSIMVDEIRIEDSICEVSGPDAKNRSAYYRLTEMKVEGSKLGIGPGAVVMPDQPGFLKVGSPTKSSEGDGKVLLEWTKLSGGYPKWSFEKKFEITGIPLTPFSHRAELAGDITIEKGTMDSQFTGTCKDGKLDWTGSMTISKDTKLDGSSWKGKMASSLSTFATGNPIGTIRVGGTLDDPQVKMPDFLAGGAFEILSKAVTGDKAGVFGMFTNAMGSAVDQGVRESEKVLDKVPGLGSLFGTKKK